MSRGERGTTSRPSLPVWMRAAQQQALRTPGAAADTALSLALRQAGVAPDTDPMRGAVVLDGLIPDDRHLKHLRLAGLRIGFTISLALRSGTGVVWYAKGLADQLPRQIGTIHDLLAFLESMANKPPAAVSSPALCGVAGMRPRPAKRVRAKAARRR